MKISTKLKYFSTLSIFFAILLTSCGTEISSSLKSPAEDGGLEGNQDQDKVEDTNDTDSLKTFLERVGQNEYYTYDLTVTLYGENLHFVNYYTPNAFFELNDVFEDSIGYAQNKDSEIFTYKLSEDFTTIYPSLFVYGDVGSIVKMTTLYNALISIPNFTFLSYSMDEFSAETVSTNKFLITDSITSSVFQYMTSYGSSIQSYVTGVYVEIIDFDSLQFKSTVKLGQIGEIVGIYKKDNSNFMTEINNQITDGLVDGYDYHEDVKSFFEIASNNNYTIEGIFEKMTVGEQTTYPQNYYCTNDYFYIEYLGNYAKDYKNWGYVFVPANTTVTYYDMENNQKVASHTQTLAYDSCYRFTKYGDEFVFDFFKGPIETSNLTYKKVTQLPLVGEQNVLYIIYNEETKQNEVYIYSETSTGSYEFTFYSTWFDCVGDFFINDYATFYLGSTSAGSIGHYFFQQSIDDPNSYYCTNRSLNSEISKSIFGWGWNPTNTWMDYVLNTTLNLRKDSNDNIYEADLGVEILLSSEVKTMYYTLKDFGSTSVKEVEDFLKGAF